MKSHRKHSLRFPGVIATLAFVGCGGSSGAGTGAGNSSPAGAVSSSGASGSSSGGNGASSSGATAGSSGAPGGGAGGASAGGSSASGAGSSGASSSGASSSGTGDSGTSDRSAASTADGGVTGASSAGVPTLFYLDLGLGRVMRAGTDGSNPTALVTSGTAQPDGVAVDVAGGYIYWTNMGDAQDGVQINNGYIQRAQLDGSGETTVVPVGMTHTPKQMKLDLAAGKMYWSDREGMRVMRANTDGSDVETLVTTAPQSDSADEANYAVGIALDVANAEMYWTQKGSGPSVPGGESGGQGTIKRAGMQMPAGSNSTNRPDIEVLFSGLPEPIDLDLDLTKRQMYWTDRGDNTVSRAPMDPPSGANPATRTDRDMLVTGAGQAIGIVLDVPNSVMYYTALDTGNVSTAAMDGSGARVLIPKPSALTELTGITLVQLPK
jgi:hypothetical protein